MGTDIKLTLHTEQVLKWLDDLATKRMTAACLHMQGAVQKTLTGQRSGRVYRVPGTKHKTYTSSAPGEPPASATGRLRKSIKYKVEGGFRELQGIVGTDVEYAAILERGGTIEAHTENVSEHTRTLRSGKVVKVRAHTRNVPARRIAARPFLRPTFERERLAVKEILARKWD